MILLIGDHEFRLAETEDAGRLEQAALSAAKAGAGFLRFGVEGGRTVAALVTPYLPVVLTDPPVRAAAATSGADDLAMHFVDFGEW